MKITVEMDEKQYDSWQNYVIDKKSLQKETRAEVISQLKSRYEEEVKYLYHRLEKLESKWLIKLFYRR